MRVLGYVLVYIGKVDSSVYPAYTNNGKSVWVTPVAAVMPDDWDGELEPYDSDMSDNPVVIHLTS